MLILQNTFSFIKKYQGENDGKNSSDVQEIRKTPHDLWQIFRLGDGWSDFVQEHKNFSKGTLSIASMIF